MRVLLMEVRLVVKSDVRKAEHKLARRCMTWDFCCQDHYLNCFEGLDFDSVVLELCITRSGPFDLLEIHVVHRVNQPA